MDCLSCCQRSGPLWRQHRLIWLSLACSLVVVCSLTSNNNRAILPQQRRGFSSSHSTMTLMNQKTFAETSSTMNAASSSDDNDYIGSDRSLAGDYMLSISSNDSADNANLDQAVVSWSLYPIDGVVAAASLSSDDAMIADGARATYSLLQADFATAVSLVEPSITLTCTISDDNDDDEARSIDVVWTKGNDVNTKFDGDKEEAILLSVLERIMVQWAAKNNHCGEEAKSWSVSLDSKHTSPEPLLIPNLTSEEGARAVFAELLGDRNTDVEWVEMVSGTGSGLGRVPRKLVHVHNLLHRGIGLFVTKDVPMPIVSRNAGTTTTESSVPDLYVHRRAADKRIFPSLYDMFVGGVSLAGEEPELTARREVAEELGLSKALQQEEEGDANGLAGPILKCVVCTAYNRCVVTLFSYTMDTQTETVHWQEEEVDWGDFVSYPVIVAAADRSIQRFAGAGKWPGTYPPVQSSNKGSLAAEDEESIESETTSAEWKEWDFVPDGLLVWEAWLELLRSESDLVS